mmetsp:Transcript_3782/g.9213  ORF Transcript_3782/g.9213 Transcript_3782/m.9213 type:complete len:107 (-) Transcript_3782:49-369(-)
MAKADMKNVQATATVLSRLFARMRCCDQSRGSSTRERRLLYNNGFAIPFLWLWFSRKSVRARGGSKENDREFLPARRIANNIRRISRPAGQFLSVGKSAQIFLLYF